mmetsp:Transcript_11798/g.19280  ORF Transcript_11798/g.19280 Transcript_11798/m.19280 type:complete len:298 (+) Transcript_11798:156-1049(+)
MGDATPWRAKGDTDSALRRREDDECGCRLVLCPQKPEILELLASWHSRFLPCKLLRSTEAKKCKNKNVSSCRVRPLTVSASSNDMWVSMDEIQPYQFLQRNEWLTETQGFLSTELVQELREVAQKGPWNPVGKERYSFGDTKEIPPRVARALRRNVMRVIVSTWPDDFDFGRHDSVQIKGDSFFLRYYTGAATPPVHMDISVDAEIGQQVANCIIYLSGISEVAGGETVLGCLPSCSSRKCICKATHISISPEAGKLVVWRTYDSHGILNPLALHTALPVAKGIKLALCLKVRRKTT